MKLSSINEDLENIDHRSVINAADYIIDTIQYLNKEYKQVSAQIQRNQPWGYSNLRTFDTETADTILTEIGCPVETYVKTGHHFTSNKPEFSAELVLKFTFKIDSSRSFQGRSGIINDKPIVLLILQVAEAMSSFHLDSHLDSLKKGITKVLYHEVRHITQKFLQIQQSGRSHKSVTSNHRTDKSYVGNPHEVDAEAAAMAHLYLALPPENRKPIRSMKGLIKMIGGDKAEEHFSSAQQKSHDAQRKVLHKVMKLIDKST